MNKLESQLLALGDRTDLDRCHGECGQTPCILLMNALHRAARIGEEDRAFQVAQLRHLYVQLLPINPGLAEGLLAPVIKALE